jgi:hypothetical protein
LGTPDKSWVEGYRLAGIMNINFHDHPPKNLYEVVPGASSLAISLLKKMLVIQSAKRINVTQVIQNEYFNDIR